LEASLCAGLALGAGVEDWASKTAEPNNVASTMFFNFVLLYERFFPLAIPSCGRGIKTSIACAVEWRRQS